MKNRSGKLGEQIKFSGNCWIDCVDAILDLNESGYDFDEIRSNKIDEAYERVKGWAVLYDKDFLVKRLNWVIDLHTVGMNEEQKFYSAGAHANAQAEKDGKIREVLANMKEETLEGYYASLKDFYPEIFKNIGNEV